MLRGNQQDQEDNQVPVRWEIIRLICYCFSLFAFGIFIYSFFFTEDAVLKKQAIYWFYTSVIVIFLPAIKQLKYKDLEVTFKEELKKVKDSFEKKTNGLKEAYLSVSEEIYPLEQDIFTKLARRDAHGALRAADKALQALDVLNNDFPDDIKVQTYRAYMLKNRAMAMQQLKQPEESNKCLDEAAKIFHTILENNPNDAGSLNGLGSVSALKGDWETALIYIDKAIKFQPDYEAAKQDREFVIKKLRQRKSK